MAKMLFGNNASALLAASISDSDLTIQVQNGFGALYPSPGADEYFLVTLENDNGDIEVVKVTQRAVDLFTVPVGGRGQEGTSAQAWTNGQARVENRLTRGTLEVFIQRGGDEMAGDLNMDGNELQDAVLTGASTQILDGEIVDVPLRGNAGDSSNEVRVPTDGTRATAGGARILVTGDTEGVREAAFVVGQIIMWYGLAVNIPDGWALCNGAGGTPDLRNRFIVGAGDAYALSATGGAASSGAGTSGAGGAVAAGNTGDTALTADMIPEHNHRLFVNITGTSSDANGFGTGGNCPVAGDQGVGGYLNTNSAGTKLVENAGGGSGGTHNHTTPAIPDHTHATPDVPTLPPYYGLFFIMFVGF